MFSEEGYRMLTHSRPRTRMAASAANTGAMTLNHPAFAPTRCRAWP